MGVRTTRRVAGAFVRRSIGTLPFFEALLRARHAPGTVLVFVRETLAVRHLRRQLGGDVVADVVTVIPTFRRPEQCADAVRSALAQTVTDHGVIVVDDGSGQLPSVTDPRLHVVSVPRNIGVVGAVRNVGRRLSRSRVVAFLDDDNTWSPDHLERALAALDVGADVAYTGLRRVDPRGTTIDHLNEPFDRAALRERSFVDASTLVLRRCRRTAWSRVPRRFGDFPREDWELVWRLGRRLRFSHVDEITVTYTIHDGSHFTAWRVSELEPASAG